MSRPKNLSEETVYKIRFLYFREDWTQQRLANYFGISQSTVCKIVNNYIHKTIADVSLAGQADVKLGYNYVNQRQKRKRLQT